MRGVRKNRYREATRTLQSGVPDNLRGCWSGLYPYASRSKYQNDLSEEIGLSHGQGFNFSFWGIPTPGHTLLRRYLAGYQNSLTTHSHP